MMSSEVYVALTTLYLRLAGYFTTGLLLHSDEAGKNKTEVDCMAVHHPWHNQEARNVVLPTFLDVRADLIDLIICEVKSSWPAFNPRLRDEANLGDALRWAGVFAEAEVQAVAPRLAALMADGVDAEEARTGIVEGNVRVRAMLSCPPPKWADVRCWCLTGPEIFRFINACYDPKLAPPTCNRKYPYELWGEPYGRIVRWFKETREAERTLDALCKHMLTN